MYLIHLSDPHFGEQLANNAPGGLPGQQPHDLSQCLQLPRALRDAAVVMNSPLPGQALPVVVTGDLTTHGATAEFAVAHAFLRGRVPLERPDPLPVEFGLARDSDGLHTVPGNHDQWQGNRLNWVPHNPRLVPSHFRQTPWVKRLPSPDSSVELQLIGLDSNSGWAGSAGAPWTGPVQGRLAMGRIADDQFAQASALLKQLTASARQRHRPYTVRAVLCHHPLDAKTHVLGVGELEPVSRDRLVRWCADHAISAVLTGHTHGARIQHIATRDSLGRPAEFHELRSPRSLGPVRRQRAAPGDESGFLTHRLQHRPGSGVLWHVWCWRWQAGGYAPSPRHPWHHFVCRTV